MPSRISESSAAWPPLPHTSDRSATSSQGDHLPLGAAGGMAHAGVLRSACQFGGVVISLNNHKM